MDMTSFYCFAGKSKLTVTVTDWIHFGSFLAHFADIQLHVIVVMPCDQVLYQSLNTMYRSLIGVQRHPTANAMQQFLILYDFFFFLFGLCFLMLQFFYFSTLMYKPSHSRDLQARTVSKLTWNNSMSNLILFAACFFFCASIQRSLDLRLMV